MGFSLRRFLEEKWADINVFDGGRTGRDVRNERPQPARTPSGSGGGGGQGGGQRPNFSIIDASQPDQQQEQPREQIKIDVQANREGLNKPQQSLGNRFRDLFDANTEADQYRRAVGNMEKPEENKPLILENPGNVISNTVGAVPRMINTAAAQVPQVYYTGAGVIAGATGNDEALANANRNAEIANSMFKKNSGGLFNAGTLYDADEARRGDLKTGVKRIGLGTAEGMLDVYSLGLTGLGGKAVAKETAEQGFRRGIPAAIASQGSNIARNAAVNTVQGGVAAGRQDAGAVDAAKAAAMSGVFGTAADIGLGVAGGTVVPKIIDFGRKLRAPKAPPMTPTSITPATDPIAYAKEYLDLNPKRAAFDYDARTRQEFGNTKNNIVSGDEAKFIIPEFAPDKSVPYHEPASGFAKNHYKNLLADPATQGEPVMIMAGGSGSGKTSALRDVMSQEGKHLDGYAAVVDTNLTTLEGANSRIQAALETGRPVEINYVYRDPTDAFVNGVVPRAARTGRVVTDQIHADTHSGSLNTVLQLSEIYKDNPNVHINVIDNSLGKGNSTISNLDLLKDKVYNRDQIQQDVLAALDDAVRNNNLTKEQADEFLHPKTNQAQDLQGQGQPVSAAPSQQSQQVSPQGQVEPPAKPAPATTPVAGGKKSRFADTTVQNSEEVSPEVQGRVREIQQATPTTSNAEHLAGSEAFLKKNKLPAATTKVKNMLNKKLGTLSDQDVSDAIATAKALDEKATGASIQASSEIYEQLSDHLKKAGQTIQAASLLNNRTPQGLIYHAEKTLKKAGVEVTDEVRQNIRDLVDNVKAAAPKSYDDGLARYKLMEYVSKNVPAGAADKGVQLWKAGLLTAPTTTAGNVLANSAEQIYKRGYKDPVATAADAVMSLFTGKRSKSYTLRGVKSGAKEGIGKGIEYFKTGYDPRDPLQKFDVHDIHYSNTLKGRMAEAYTQSVFKLMGGQDQPFYYASLRNSLADQAVTEAKNAGLKGSKRQDFIKKFVTEPTQEALQLADTEARYDVFQNPTALGNLASKVNKGAIGQYIIPFSQVPSSVATRMIDRTPIGIAKEIVGQIKKGKFDQRAMSSAIADGSAGLLFIGAGAALTKAGLLTTSYPTDPKERDLWELEGKQPNSVKIGNTWVSLNYMQPMGTLFAAGANYQKALQDGGSKTDAFSSAAAGASKALTEQSFLKGISGGLQALSDPQRSAEKFAEQTVGSLVPNIIRSGARSADDKNRDQDGLFESFLAGVPFARESLNEKTDIFGDAIPRKTGAIHSFVNPFRPSDERQKTNTTTELRRLQDADEGVTATKILSNALGDGAPKLSKDQQRELKNEIGQRLKQDWEKIVTDPNYAGLSDTDKRRKLEDVKNDITGAYKAKYGVEKSIVDPDPSKLSKGEKRVLLGDDVNYFAGADKERAEAEVEKFKEGNEKFKEIGDRVYFRKKNGDVDSKSKFDYEYDKDYSKVKLNLDRAKSRGDLKGWLDSAEKQYELLQSKKEQYDPSFESSEIDKITLQQENLLEQVAKYQSYGGFKKGSSGGGSRKKTRSSLGLDYSMFGISNFLGTQKSLRKLLQEAKLG